MWELAPPECSPARKGHQHGSQQPREPGCGVTVVVDAEEQAWTRQRVPFGTTEWAALYGRRSGVEHFNAEIKHNRGVKIVRGFTRVHGAVKNHVLLTFALIGANVRLLRDWHICRSAPDPWMGLIGDTDDPDWNTTHAQIKRRQKRKRALHEAYFAAKQRPNAAAWDTGGSANSTAPQPARHHHGDRAGWRASATAWHRAISVKPGQ